MKVHVFRQSQDEHKMRSYSVNDDPDKLFPLDLVDDIMSAIKQHNSDHDS